MNNADLPAFPQPETHDAGKFTGLTKLEYLSGVVLQGIISSGNHFSLTAHYSASGNIAEAATAIARKLLSELEKTKTKP